LEAALNPKAPEPKVVRELGKRYFEGRNFARAEEMFELGRRVEPNERQWLVELARVHGQAGARDKQIHILKALVPTDGDDLPTRKRLAQLLLEAGQHAGAERYAREVLEIDILDKDGQDILDKALRGQKKDAEADRLRKLLAVEG